MGTEKSSSVSFTHFICLFLNDCGKHWFFSWVDFVIYSLLYLISFWKKHKGSRQRSGESSDFFHYNANAVEVNMLHGPSLLGRESDTKWVLSWKSIYRNLHLRHPWRIILEVAACPDVFEVS